MSSFDASLLLYSLLDRTIAVPFGGNDWIANYTEGDLFELNKKLLLSETKYPIIWLQTGYKESEYKSGSKVELSGCKLFLITIGDKTDMYKKRFETNYKEMLFPLFNKVKDAFRTSQGVEILNDKIEYFKLPFNDVSELTSRDSALGSRRNSQTTTIPDIWDAIVINDLNLRINVDCYPEFKI